MSLEIQSALVAAATAIASGALTFVLIRLSKNLNLVAKARSDRWHMGVTPNTGGIAVALSCATACELAIGGGVYRFIIGVSAALALFGIIDDRVQFRPLVKLAGQTIAAAAVIAGGVVCRPTTVEPLNVAITFLWIIGITNAFNLIDNMDGLCAGVAIIIAGFRFVAAVGNSDAGGAMALAIVAGGFFGFLLFNYKPAKIFMGDGGSMFAGFVLATLAITSPVARTRVFVSGLFYPALTFLYPIFDTALVSVLRRLAGRPVSVGGRDHSSHRLVSIGLSERKAVWLLWGLAAAGSAAGLLTSSMPQGVICIAVLLVAGSTLFGIFLGTLPAYEMPETAPARLPRVRKLIPTLRAGITIFVDMLLAGVALLCAFLLRWDNSFHGELVRQFLFALPLVCACHGLACLAFRSYYCGWRWFGIHDVFMLAKCVVCGCGLFMLALWMSGVRDFSRGVVLFYAVLSLCLAAGLRLVMRLLPYLRVDSAGRERAAVLGATAAGELTIIICLKNGLSALPVVVLETDPAANHTTIHGVPVRSAGADPAGVLRKVKAGTLIVPPNVLLAPADREVILACEKAGIRVVCLEFLMTPLPRTARDYSGLTVAHP